MTPIEKVAIALAKARSYYFMTREPTIDDVYRAFPEAQIIAEARAAIEAMANPTDEMIEAGNTVSGDPASDVVSAIWQAMIAVALRQQEG